MARLEKAVSLYINRANEVFYFNQDEIENASEYKSIGMSDNESSSRSESGLLPQMSKSLNLQSLLNPHFKQAMSLIRESVDKSLPIHDSQNSFSEIQKVVSSSMIRRPSKSNSEVI